MNPHLPEPDGREARPAWSDVPPAIIAQLEKLLKHPIIKGETTWGGYSNSAVFTVTLDTNEKFFIKGTHPGQDAHGLQTVRQEIEAYDTVPGIDALSPRYLGMVSDGGEDGWALMAFSHIDTVPTLPWTAEKPDKFLELLARLHNSHAEKIPPVREKNYIERFLRAEGGWLRINYEPAITTKFLTLFEDAAAGEKWFLKAAPVLCREQRKITELKGRTGVLHQDLRSDNILFDRAGRSYIVDWPNVCIGPVVLDLAQALPGISAESEFTATQLLEMYERKSGIKTDTDSLSAALASLSGHMADNAYRAAPNKLPRLRWMQKKMLWGMLHWASVLMDIPTPSPFKR